MLLWNQAAVTSRSLIVSRSPFLPSRSRNLAYISQKNMHLRLGTALVVALSQSSTSLALSSSSSAPKSMSSTSAAAASTARSGRMVTPDSPLAPLVPRLDNSWPRTLMAETEENYKKSLKVEGIAQEDDIHQNQQRRPVFNGHYVLVPPKGLPNPELILVSDSVAQDVLGLSPEQIDSEDFVQWLSGNLVLGETWATPYALSIMGSRYTNNCPYGTGNGYGDGRAISIAEFQGQELQLKGAGTTPFARGADGRAVLRSSIREFLASEAMHALGIATTRALSLIQSKTATVMRPWYTKDAVLDLPSLDDPRLSQYSMEDRKRVLQQLRHQSKADPNRMRPEPCAIACRVAPSFSRIGHVDLFSRRVTQTSLISASVRPDEEMYDTNTREWTELEALVVHIAQREFASYLSSATPNGAEAARVILDQSALAIARMVAGWIRVGFAQGNFNADNCLIGGRTMDYGPFGFMEEYYPLFAKWTGSGQHFGFLNQPSAGLANYQVLVESIAPLLVVYEHGNKQGALEGIVGEYMQKAQEIFQQQVDQLFRQKLGLADDADVGDDLWESLEPLMRASRVDWTIFWRELTNVAKDFDDLKSTDYEAMLKALEGEDESGAFYEPLDASMREKWLTWLEQWRDVLDATETTNAYETMKKANPKFVLREWMLVEAYEAAAEGDMIPLQELYQLIEHPYDEGTPSQSSRFYRRAPDAVLQQGGTAFMS